MSVYYRGWPVVGPRPTFDPNVRARALARSRRVDLPEFWISPGYSSRKAAARQCDVIHRGPACPVSQLNVPWYFPGRVPAGGFPVAFDLAAIDPHTRLCGCCFTETEIDMLSEIGYYETPEQPHADRVKHAKEIAKSRPGLTDAQGLVILDIAAALMVRPGVAEMQVWFDEDGEAQLRAHLMSALVRRAGHDMYITGGKHPQTAIQFATCEITRRDKPDRPYVVTMDMDDAVRAELAPDPIFAKNPLASLKRRATAECIRDACAEVLFGMDVIQPAAKRETAPVEVAAA